jgi:N-acetylneuraminate synthase
VAPHQPAARLWVEVGSNHNRDLNRALEFVDAAAELGADALKLQAFTAEHLFAPAALERSESCRRMADWELPLEHVPTISAACHDRGLRFACSVFDIPTVARIAPYCDALKVSSYDVLRLDLLEACARTGKEVVLSTGMATMDEVDLAVDALDLAGCHTPTLLHCTSSYPTPPGQCNLAVIEALREKFFVPVGWSDHTRSPAVLLRAALRWGAELLEVHLDLDGTGREFGDHCWTPHELRTVVDALRLGTMADGDGEKAPAPCEAGDRLWRADPSDGLRPMREAR